MSDCTPPVGGPACCPSVVAAPLDHDEAVDIAAVFAALADPVRVTLFSLIASTDSICSCDLMAPVGKSQPTISHHTRVLAEAGLIRGEKRGRWVHWSAIPERLEDLRGALTP